MTARAIETELNLTAGNYVLVAAIACGSGETRPLAGLDWRDKMLAVMLVAIPYVPYAQASGYRSGVHVMVADPSEAADHGLALTGVARTLGLTVTDLNSAGPADADGDTDGDGDDAGDIIVGTPEAFLARYAYLTDNDLPHHTPGVVALALGTEVRDRASGLLAHYPRAAVI